VVEREREREPIKIKKVFKILSPKNKKVIFQKTAFLTPLNVGKKLVLV
jgi:hypothetical protein